MKRVLAISGGVDSMVLLDFCVKKYGAENLIVGTFNHGTRSSADDDALFVERKCKELGIEFHCEKAELGEGVSEDDARIARYEFLKNLAHNKQIYVAHHLDDLCESVAINFIRGTGIRGLTVMNNPEIERPFLSWTKNNILKYAAENQIIFREDPTNSSDDYLRNRIRFSVRNLDFDTKKKILELRNDQCRILNEINTEISEILKENIRKLDNGTLQIPREIFYNLDDKIAIEILREILIQKNISCTRPQIQNFLTAIRTYMSGKMFNLPHDRLVKIHKKYFML